MWPVSRKLWAIHLWPSGTRSWPRQFSETVALTDHKLYSAININVSSYSPASKKFEISFAHGGGSRGGGCIWRHSQPCLCELPGKIAAISCTASLQFLPLHYHLLSVQLRSASAPFSYGRFSSQVLRPPCLSTDPLLGFFYLEINNHVLSFFLSPHDLIITSSYQWIIFDCPYLPLWVVISHLQRSPACGQFGVIRVKFPPSPSPFFLTRFKWAELQFLSHLPNAMCDLALWHTHKLPLSAAPFLQSQKFHI